MTTRRTAMLGALLGSCLGTGLDVCAQIVGRVARIGWLSSAPLAPSPAWDAFVEGMRERGWIEGRDYTVENLISSGRGERLPALAAELVQRKVDLIIGAGTPPTSAAMKATSTIPIVFYYAGDPVGSGFVASLPRPGGNVTGLGGLGPGLHAKQMELLKEAVPRVTRIGMLFNPDLSLHASNRAEVESVARKLGLALRPVELRTPADIEPDFATLAHERVDALHIFGQPFLFAHREHVAALALEHKLPAINPFVEVVRAGLLMSYGDRMVDALRRVPHYVDRILRGASPAEMPVEQSTRFYLTVNLKTARAIGLVMPQGLLLRADEVIE